MRSTLPCGRSPSAAVPRSCCTHVRLAGIRACVGGRRGTAECVLIGVFPSGETRSRPRVRSQRARPPTVNTIIEACVFRRLSALVSDNSSAWPAAVLNSLPSVTSMHPLRLLCLVHQLAHERIWVSRDEAQERPDMPGQGISFMPLRVGNLSTFDRFRHSRHRLEARVLLLD